MLAKLLQAAILLLASPKCYFIRFGDLPENGQSWNDGESDFESGVSGYLAEEEEGVWYVDESQIDNLRTGRDLHAEVVAGHGRPIYLFLAEKLDECGGDGEALFEAEGAQKVASLTPVSRKFGEYRVMTPSSSERVAAKLDDRRMGYLQIGTSKVSRAGRRRVG